MIHTIAKAPLPSFNEGEGEQNLTKLAFGADNITEGEFDPWPDFRYTGTLRAVYPLSPKRAVPKHINKPDYAKDGK